MRECLVALIFAVRGTSTVATGENATRDERIAERADGPRLQKNWISCEEKQQFNNPYLMCAIRHIRPTSDKLGELMGRTTLPPTSTKAATVVSKDPICSLVPSLPTRNNVTLTESVK